MINKLDLSIFSVSKASWLMWLFLKDAKEYLKIFFEKREERKLAFIAKFFSRKIFLIKNKFRDINHLKV